MIAGAFDRTGNTVGGSVVQDAGYDVLQSFVAVAAAPGAKAYTDEHPSYLDMPFDHRAVKLNIGQYVPGDVHMHEIESLRTTLKRAHQGTSDKIGPKHMGRYVAQFAGSTTSGTPTRSRRRSTRPTRSWAGG